MRNYSSIITAIIFCFCNELCAQDSLAEESPIDTTIYMSINSATPKLKVHYFVSRSAAESKNLIATTEISFGNNTTTKQIWSDTLVDQDLGFMSFSEVPQFIDFNFDGYLDYCLEVFISGVRPPVQLMFFRQYNPRTKLFEKATQFDNLAGTISVGEDHTIEEFRSTGCGEMCWVKNIYKYNGKQLVFVKQIESLWDEKNGYIEVERNKKLH